MKKLIFTVIVALSLSLSIQTIGKAATTTYTVQNGDSLWKIAVRFEVGLSEIISANPQFKNPSLIYPGQKVNIPLITEVKNFEKEVIRLTNIERANNGLPALKENWELSRVARFKSADMRDKGYFSHTSPTYGSPFTMIKQFGISYKTAGENIAAGQTTPSSVVQAWMNSPGHRANILSANYKEIGVGYAQGGTHKHYWTQMFISR